MQSNHEKQTAPRVPDWDMDEILRWISGQYDEPETRREETELSDTELLSAAAELEPDQTDLKRQLQEANKIQKFIQRYDSRFWVTESPADYKKDASKKKSYKGFITNKDVEGEWMYVEETRYEE